MPKAPKQKNRVQVMPNAGVREVNYIRDIPGDVGVPQHVRDQLTAQSMLHTDVRKQLDVLRKTRGQRTLEPLKVPVHLSTGIPMSADDVKPRGDLAQVLPED